MKTFWQIWVMDSTAVDATVMVDIAVKKNPVVVRIARKNPKGNNETKKSCKNNLFLQLFVMGKFKIIKGKFLLKWEDWEWNLGEKG